MAPPALETLIGSYPNRLVMDQKVTNQDVLAELDDRGITWLTLRMRSTALNQHIAELPGTAWKTVRLDRNGKHQRPRVDETVTCRTTPARLGRRHRDHHQRLDLHRRNNSSSDTPAG